MASRGPLSLKARAIGLVAQREHSRTELRIEQQRAQQTVASADADGADHETPTEDDDPEARSAAIDALLDSLAADGYLDETRFVESRLHVRAGRFGTQRIQQELARHGLKLDADQQTTLRETELERAREVWHKRFGAEPPRDATAQARQTRFLLTRGFAPDLVRRLLRA